MLELIGSSLPAMIVVTFLTMGFSALMTGIGLATTWRPVWQVIPYCLLLGLADRFLVWSLFKGELLLLSGYLIDTIFLTLVCLLAYRVTQVHRMLTQYPWLYERSGLLNWRERKSV
ncbi:MAG: hypothetical protein QNJ30_05295 [Kiloniellales bacterium]|nr:hypothetical protein [Kiloniellales bacterium]